MKPMLAATIEDVNQLKFPLIASPKLDGIRALIVNGKVVSRNLKPIPNKHVQKLFSKLPEGFDGELIVGSPTSKTCFRDTSSGCMSVDGTPDVMFYVFDDYAPGDIYSTRRKLLEVFFLKNKDKTIKIVPQQRIKDVAALREYEQLMLNRGFEGIMLRHPDGMYKFGRSTLKEAALMKLKKFEDSEATVLSIEELMRNDNELQKDNLGRAKRSSHKANLTPAGKMGSLTVKDRNTGVVFDIGAGFTESDRCEIWCNKSRVIGKIIKYKYFPTGSKDKPRFPVFLGFRDKRDL